MKGRVGPEACAEKGGFVIRRTLRRHSACAALVLAFILLSGGISPARARRVRVGVYHNPPIVSLDADGTVQGFTIDILRYIAGAEGWDLVFVPGTWSECLDRLRTGRLDLQVAIAYTPDRARWCEFGSETVLANWGRVCARPGAGISSLLDLKGRTVAVLRGDVFEAEIRRLMAAFDVACRFLPVDSYRAVLEAVAAGRADAGVLNRLYLARAALAPGVELTPVVFSPIEVRFAAPRGRRELLEAIDRNLRSMKGRPGSAYERALERWLGGRTPSSFPPWIVGVVAALGAAAVMAVGFVAALRREVRVRTARLREANQALEREVAEREKAQRALRETHEALAAVFDASPAAIVTVDREGRVTGWNPAAERMFGWSWSEVLGRFPPYVPEDAQDEARRLMEEVSRGQVVSSRELRRLRKDGSEIQVLFSGSPLRDPDGQITGMVGILLDVTEARRAQEARRRLEAKMHEVQKLESLGLLAGGIAHDFNNLLMGVLGNADLALLKLAPESPARAHVEAIEKAARRAADLTNQMLAYSGKGRFVVERIDLNRLVEEMSHLLGTVISKKATIKFDLAPGLPPVEGDPTQLRQVVMNLITNASDAIGDRVGLITVTTGVMRADREYLQGTFLDEDLPEGDYVFLEVSDTGCGMDPATRARIFDPFFTTKFAGRGLGLAAVLGIVRAHHGAIKVYSEPGRGSTFKILLPRCDAVQDLSQADPPFRASADPFAGPTTVLLVDDDEAVRTVATMMLEEQGFDVIVATDGTEGVERFRMHAEDIRVVILDLTMPGLSGEEAFREIRRIRPDVPVILTSGYNENDVTTRFAGKGVAGFIQKPFRTAELMEVLRKALSREPERKA